ncbi:hypothetical protein OGATHE_004954 [Ogataea polymorpha]|uniref:Uncharacterized protein n=1 Tax=Ogataea polymorpha TaxID=460523 RepID=A0A9P8NWA5_9ASCO|nr:hypothetical protein OGATHE_004954 [Ogataea polymorpha]
MKSRRNAPGIRSSDDVPVDCSEPELATFRKGVPETFWSLTQLYISLVMSPPWRLSESKRVSAGEFASRTGEWFKCRSTISTACGIGEALPRPEDRGLSVYVLAIRFESILGLLLRGPTLPRGVVTGCSSRNPPVIVTGFETLVSGTSCDVKLLSSCLVSWLMYLAEKLPSSNTEDATCS